LTGVVVNSGCQIKSGMTVMGVFYISHIRGLNSCNFRRYFLTFVCFHVAIKTCYAVHCNILEIMQTVLPAGLTYPVSLKDIKMNHRLKSLLLVFGMSAVFAGAVQAKDEPKKAASAPVVAAAPAASAATPAAPAAAEKAVLLDINSATQKELAELPKIGEARSAAIIKGRPYKGKDELVIKKILTEDVYNGIKDSIIAKQKPAEKKK
jgi:competence protein ComEA